MQENIALDFQRIYIPAMPQTEIPSPEEAHTLLPSTSRGGNDLAVAIVSAGAPRLPFLESCLALERASQGQIQWNIIPSGPYMDMARNRATLTSLERPFDFLLTLDDDLEFTPEDVYDLLAWARSNELHVVSGVYASVHNASKFAVAYRHPNSDSNEFIDLTLDEVDVMDSRNPATCQVAAAGSGFMLIHRSVLELMPLYYNSPSPWYAEVTAPDAKDTTNPLGVHLGEDLTFCYRLAQLGIPIYLHPKVRLTHYKTIGLIP